MSSAVVSVEKEMQRSRGGDGDSAVLEGVVQKSLPEEMISNLSPE